MKFYLLWALTTLMVPADAIPRVLAREAHTSDASFFPLRFCL